MSQARTAARRRRQCKINFTHLAVHGDPPRPLYHHRDIGSVHDAIARERHKAAREARAKASKKNKAKGKK